MSCFVIDIAIYINTDDSKFLKLLDFLLPVSWEKKKFIQMVFFVAF